MENQPSDVQPEKSFREKRETEAALTSWSSEGYMNALGLIPEDLYGKTILDLGSGEEENFARYAETFGAHVVSMNPKLREDKYRKTLVESGDWRGNSVAGRAQELPFTENSFDLVVSYMAIPMWLPKETPEQFEQEMYFTTLGIYRALKPGGKFYFYPLDLKGLSTGATEEEILQKNLGNKTINFLKEEGVLIKIDYGSKGPRCVLEKLTD